MSQYDLVIVGGGIGGSALGAVMARAGRRVLVLERTEVFEDRVRGEWIAPWGVVETRRVGLYDRLLAAGGHHVTRHITYDETLDPVVAEAGPLPLSIFREGVPGPLCLGHPLHCQTLIEAAAEAGAEVRRGVNVIEAVGGDAPHVVFEHEGQTHTAHARLLVGADGRTSQVREAAGIALHQDAPHHWFAGLLVEGADGWDADLQAIGTEGDFGFLAFPQGDGRVRVYGGYALDQAARFKGPDGARRFLDAFAMSCSPANRHLVAGRPAGPLLSYVNADSWTDEPFAPGVVLVGDAAGWNDPILGLGLSITYRDVRIVSEILNATDDWSVASLAPYAEERRERMRRLRFTAKLQASLDMEFGEAAKARRHSHFARAAADPSLRAHAFAVMAGPEVVPEALFTEAHRARVLGLDGAHDPAPDIHRAPGMTRPDIRSPQGIDAAWLSAVLREGGVEAMVDGFSAKPIGTGQIGDSVRFELRYAHAPVDAPASLVGKFPSASPESRATGVALLNYLREVRFYQQLAAGARISTPRCWFTEVDEATSDFVLMMEDLAPAEQGDQLQGVSLEQARLVIVEAAKLHASHWNDEGLDDLPWVQGAKAAPASAATNDAVTVLWNGFKARYGDRVKADWADVGDRLAANFGGLLAAREGPRCLTHNDFRPDNMMFASAAGGAPVTVLDWQSFAYGVGATDVAYFLAGALPGEARRRNETELLDLYHRTLIAEGVSGYGPDALLADYKRGAYLLFLTAFFAAMIVKQTPRGDDMFIQMLGSAAEHMIEHDALEGLG